jgi:hypothetical protein
MNPSSSQSVHHSGHTGHHLTGNVQHTGPQQTLQSGEAGYLAAANTTGLANPTGVNAPVANTGSEFLVQNHPDTVNNHGRGHNVNAGKIQVASLNPTAPTTMNTNPVAPNLTNMAKETHTVPAAPGKVPSGYSANAGSRLTGDLEHGSHHNKAGKEKFHSTTGLTNVVAPQAIATHLSGNPGMNTSTNIQNQTGLGSNHTLHRNANIGDEINTNPVATTHPQANVSGGDIHTNQLLNSRPHLGSSTGLTTGGTGNAAHHKPLAHGNNLSAEKSRNLGTDNTLDKERPLYK